MAVAYLPDFLTPEYAEIIEKLVHVGSCKIGAWLEIVHFARTWCPETMTLLLVLIMSFAVMGIDFLIKIVTARCICVRIVIVLESQKSRNNLISVLLSLPRSCWRGTLTATGALAL